MLDTIYAPATAQGRAGISIVRVSGPDTFSAVRALCGGMPEPRKAVLRELKGVTGDILDHGLVLTFPGPASFTGEDVAEFHLHGAPAIVAAVARELGNIPGCRMAEPGEFTRRAFENGRLDLSQVEGLADLIDAETEAQRVQALRIFSGALGEKVESWRYALIRSAALLEATIDFVDEDVPADVSPEVGKLLEDVLRDLRRHGDGAASAERIRLGYEVAIVGRPNVGKSTLLNALAGREAAITSHIAGTTRDVIEVRMDLGGLAVTLLDTAGVRESIDEVERLGVSRAMKRSVDADLRVFLIDEDGLPDRMVPSGEDIIVWAKVDLSGKSGVSGKTGEGLGTLTSLIGERLAARSGPPGLFIRERHRMAAERAVKLLESGLHQLKFGPERPELVAEEVRSAIRALETLLGRVDAEAILGEIFASFCLGK